MDSLNIEEFRKTVNYINTLPHDSHCFSREICKNMTFLWDEHVHAVSETERAVAMAFCYYFKNLAITHGVPYHLEIIHENGKQKAVYAY